MGIVVIGRGLVGAAAARHLAEAGEEVTLVGPAEPDDWATHDGPFASSYDSGRITRVADEDPTWALLAARSIGRYADIAERGGVEFHFPVGLVAQMADLEAWAANSPTAEPISADEVADRFGIHLPESKAIFESAPAGFVDPRRMVVAQVEAARRAGATIIDEVVTELPVGERVLIAAGAFTPELLPGIALDRHPRTTLLAETDPAPAMPSLIVRDPVPACESIYWVPPTDYPDGKTYLKIGGSVPPIPTIDDPEELRAWFHSDGSDAEAAALHEALVALVPEMEIRSVVRKPCVTTTTESGLPFIGAVDDNVYLAAAGNGSAGKSADEIGRLGAELARHGRWTDDDLDHSLFTPVFRT